MLRVRDVVRELPMYHPPLGNREGLRLDFNENAIGCSPEVLRCMRHLTSEQLSRYPERGPIESISSSYIGIEPKELLLTNGTDEAIHLLCEAHLEPGNEALIVVPTFSMYTIYARATGARVIVVPAGKNFSFPTADLLSKITWRTRLIAVANPNNPTGTLASQDDLLQIARMAPDAAVLIDEAYFEFCGQTLIGKWHEIPNLFISRTFSKAYGLAGLRIGALAGDVAQIEMVRRVSSPYNVNGVALACLPGALADVNYVGDYVKEVCQGRELLQDELRDLEVPYWPSSANFVLARFGSGKLEVLRAMRDRGILLRDRSRDFGCDGCVRITIGTLEQTKGFIVALREVLTEIGIKEPSML